MRKVLVTGGAGYIGCLAVEELLKRGHKPIVFDSFFWGKESLEAFKDKVEIIEGDCRNSKDVVYALEKADSVFHFAGIVGEGACKKNPNAHFTENIECTNTIVNCCTDPELELTRDFIFASSCSVYGNVQGIYDQVNEMTPANPLSDYAHAKLRAEQIILEKAKKISHFHPTILRLTTLFGWSPRPRLDLVTNAFTYNAWKDGKLKIYGDGKQYRSLIHVKDIAKAFADVLEAPRFMRDSKIFHVGEENNNKTVKEIAEIVKKFLPKTKIEFVKNQPTDRRDYAISCKLIKNSIGWKAQMSVEDGVKELLEKLESMKLDWKSDKYRNVSYDYV